MSHKVAYNTVYGGFSLSRLGLDWLVDHGHPMAIEVARGPNPLDDNWTRGVCWDGPRHDPMLVLAVETLGSAKVSGPTADIQLHELRGDRYIIREYDGLETVIEPDEIHWVSIS